MGLCYSLRPLLFGDPEDAPRAATEPPAESARPGLAPAPAQTPAATPAPAAGGAVARTPPPRGAGGGPACARPKATPRKEWRRRPDPQRAEEREAEREARKVSRNIDRMLREQKRDLQQTHRLLLLGRCRRRRGARARELGAGTRGGDVGRRGREGDRGPGAALRALAAASPRRGGGGRRRGLPSGLSVSNPARNDSCPDGTDFGDSAESALRRDCALLYTVRPGAGRSLIAHG